MAVLFFFFGLLYNPILALVGIFVFFGARGENNMVQQDELLSGFKVKDVMSNDYEVVEPSDNIEKAKDKFIATCDDILLVMEDGTPKGIIRRNEVISTIKERGENIQISEITWSDYDALETNDPLANIMGKIRNHGQSTFPVTENGKIAGVISLDHLQRFLSIRSELSY
jgi:predicted transcriptional regulator